jgi:propionyl-CoA carboxylase alpha chain
VLGALERLQLGTRRRLAGQLVGGHRSPRYGSSLDFADFREYQPGDDFRRIDYLTLARLDQLLVRLYDAEDDLTVRLIVDTSASMSTDGKLQRAAELAKLMPVKTPPDTSNLLLCPMPGVIVSILVNEGDEVQDGQALAVVEAMKMENTLRAEKKGIIAKINAAAGDNLAVDEIIMEFET